ncbi:carbamoyltransferase C-terminal domain-containing protein [Bradyrhizobium sp. 187]|uniref:carbamoyltransferase C-terminal domain-containing protein n=1 Tax=Bradyrhizobium sp. 187 TaxID=2782655 RepID=UPI001FFFCB6A|nr:carbamoyltransferase C-terminal domain-containing protein [Bradyrhizobium sp. 187]
MDKIGARFELLDDPLSRCEEFRPFCPSVLCERQAEYSENTFHAPFLVVTFPVNQKVADTMPAGVHVDNTARIQSVHADSNPLYDRLIGEFAEATLLPVLINTSLNINEQSTMNAPLEALHTYFCTVWTCCISATIG